MRKYRSRGSKRTLEIVFLSLGSNLGDRLEYLKKAERRLMGHRSIELLASSSIRETPPLGYTKQPSFLNQTLKAKTSLSPFLLLEDILSIEDSIGRRRQIRWGPRSIDIDILLYGDMIIDSPHLKVPHPHLLERPFLIYQLVELDRDVTDPVTGMRLIELMSRWSKEELSFIGKSYRGVTC
ncbi:MAG: 2-amino-4-hydroxy-6-hydroxymethyldihydropteridine diphosphokinase [Candidatus Glassbacteria bacterium]